MATLQAQLGWTFVAQEATNQNLWSVAYGSGTLVAVGEQGTIISYRYSDPVWRQEISPATVWLVGVGFGAGRFVVVGDHGILLTSDDGGVTWTPRVSGTTSRLNAAAYGGGRWVVVGEQGVVLTSSDGEMWSKRPALGSGFLRALAWGQGQFLIGGATGALFSTPDAETFAALPFASTSNIESIAISPNRVWVVGSNGLWATGVRADSLGLSPSLTTATFRGVVARTNDEVVAVAERGAAVFRNETWVVDAPPPPFLATAVARGEGEMIAVGFDGGIARTHVVLPPVTVYQRGPAEYGSDARLEVILARPDNTLQWTLFGVPIPGATQPVLYVLNVTPETSRYELHTEGGGVHSVSIDLFPAGQPEVRDPQFVSALPSAPRLVVPQPDGRLLVAGSILGSPSGGLPEGIARLHVDGSMDRSFGAGVGVPASSSIYAMHLLADGRIYVRGSFTSIAGQARTGLVRLLPDGGLDDTFQPLPITASIYRSAVSPDGRLYVQAGFDFLGLTGEIIRFNLDGSIDPQFPSLKKHRLLGVDSKGRLLAAAGEAAVLELVRYHASGARDTTYLAATVVCARGPTYSNDDLETTAITEKGLYAVSEVSTRFQRTDTFTRYLPDGGRDLSYRGPSMGVSQSDGVIGTTYRSDGGFWRTRGGLVPGSYTTISYTPEGDRDSTRYAVRPDQSDFQILAIAPDDSLLGVGNRYSRPGIPEFFRIRPLTGRVGRFLNLSARGRATADNPLIAGFVTTGSGTTTALVRGIGPGLTQFGVNEVMSDPRVVVVADGKATADNDQWDAGLSSRFAQVGAFALPEGSRDAALETNVGPGAYTALVVPGANDHGSGLVELYHAQDPHTASRRFVNLSARAFVDASHPLIAGFSIAGEVPVQVFIRAAGPTLAAPPFNLADALPDPMLTLYRGTTALWDNNNWSGSGVTDEQRFDRTAAAVGAFPFLRRGNDSAMLVTLAPGNYTAVVTGLKNTSGTALVEVYEVP
ncbi:MAG: hypothetical protein U1F61_28340 [Opitutaceae bacterium]